MRRLRALWPLAIIVAAPSTARAAGQPAAGPAPSTAEATPLPAPAPPPPAASETPVDADAARDSALWAERDRQLSETDAISGGVGLLHTQHAVSGAPGQFRMGFTSEFFSAGFLCSTTFPCPNPNANGAPITSDTLSHFGGTLTLSATVTKWLEVYAATGAYGSADSSNRPSLLQVFGDSQIGLKAFYPLSPVFHVGGVTELDLVNGSGAVGLTGAGTGAKFRAIGTADLRGLGESIPLRMSLNLGYAVDDTAQVVAAYEAATGGPVTRIERFGLEFNRVDHFDVAFGAETFLLRSLIRPFLEYTLLVPVNRQGYACPVVNASGDHCLENDAVVPSKLTVGSRFFPWKHGFSVVAAFDVGVTGTSDFIEEVAPTPPWMLYLGVGWAVDTWDRPPVEIRRTVEHVVPPKVLGQLRGFVHPKDKSDGIPGAIVAFEDHPDITSRVSGADGRFAVPVEPGTYKLAVHVKGYQDGKCGGEMGPTPADVPVDCPLEPALVNVTANEITIDKQIQFQVDSANILSESDGLMREIADTLIKNPRIKKVEVQGHTDSSGSNEYNQALSEQRAMAVRDGLVSRGVAPERLVAHGYGEDRPLIPNVTRALKALNRRVQFIILEQTPAPEK
jgi:outer membrane protein OmpA-like peptidoglycan-associated protein